MDNFSVVLISFTDYENYCSDFKVASNQRNKLKSHTQENIGDQFQMKNATCSTLSFYSDQSLNDFSFYALFNGHSSDIISKYLAKELLNMIIQADPPFFDESAKKPPILTSFTENMKTPIKQAFESIERSMRDLSLIHI